MSDAPAVAQFAAQHETEMIADLDLLVSQETPSDRPDLLRAGLDRIEAYLVERLGEPVRRVRHDGVQHGDMLDVTWAGSSPGTVLCLCHYDTVWPEV